MTSAELRAEMLNARVRETRAPERRVRCECGRPCHYEAARLRAVMDEIEARNETSGAVNAAQPTKGD